MDRKRGGKTGTGGMKPLIRIDANAERLRQPALETVALNKDPCFMKNPSGGYECKLCLTQHNNEGSYLAHKQGKKHLAFLARRAAKRERDQSEGLPFFDIPKIAEKKEEEKYNNSTVATVPEQSKDGRPYGPVYVEVLQKRTSSCSKTEIQSKALSFLGKQSSVKNNSTYNQDQFDDGFLTENVDSITVNISDCPDATEITMDESFMDRIKPVNVYRLIYEDPAADDLDPGCENGEVTASNIWALPNAEFEGLWEHLVFDSNVKEKMLSYVNTMLLMSDLKVNPKIIQSNRMLLFHGPPGGGKTSICRALAQKLSIRLDGRYRWTSFVEINSHSLFSKWFSESGKLVQKMFCKIRELLEDDKRLVVVLVDEVESLTVARKQALSGNEPSDAVRVVNALLTQLDFIRRWPNVLILTTSNISEAIDPAFLDRADIKQYIGLPTTHVIYKILLETIHELQRCEIVEKNDEPFVTNQTELRALISKPGRPHVSRNLFHIARLCEGGGISGRKLRKLPILAHAFMLQTGTVYLEDFVSALHVVAWENADKELLKKAAPVITFD